MKTQEKVHPLLRRLRAPIPTRPIDRMVNAIISAMEAEYRGILIFGLARFGKSWAVKYLCAFANWLNFSFYATKVIVPKDHSRSHGAFFSLWLDGFHLVFPESSTPLDRRKRVRNFIIDRCEEAGSDVAVIFMDEAQRLFPDDYEHLVTLDNDLTERGYMLFVVFVVQRDFNGSVWEKIYDGNPTPHVRKRFLIRNHEFTGLDGEEEVTHALSRYDDQRHTEWPIASGCCYTRFFAEEAFDNGWRLQSHGPRLFEIACELRAAYKLPAVWTWPMKSFEVCVNYLLTNVARSRSGFDGFGDADLSSALQAAGFIELEASRSTEADD